MKYTDGLEIRIGDKVRLGQDEGTVVCSIDAKEFSIEHPEEQWGYLKKGIMVDFPKIGLVHFPEHDPNLELMYRSSM